VALYNVITYILYDWMFFPDEGIDELISLDIFASESLIIKLIDALAIDAVLYDSGVISPVCQSRKGVSEVKI